MARPLAFADLEAALLEACAGEEEWPARIAAGVSAGVDFAIAHPEVGEVLSVRAEGDGRATSYELIISRLTRFLRRTAPTGGEVASSAERAMVAGMVGMVADYLRIGRTDRLQMLRREFVLIALLPYLGFSEAQEWANRGSAPPRP